jgi:hypothetical protein
VPELIVTSSFVGVRKNFVGFGRLFELIDRVGVPLIRIRMVLHGQLAICLGNLILGGRLADPENFVVITF